MVMYTVLQLMQNSFRLTNREVEILSLIFQGCTSTKRISEVLDISESTANKYIESLSRKIGFHGKSSLVASALQGMSHAISPLLFPGKNLASPRVAIIDDDMDLSESLAENLSRHGLNAIAIREPVSPLREIRDLNSEVLLCDLVLPVSDGVKVARGIAEELPMSPCLILMTGYPELLNKRFLVAMRGLFASVIVKPLEISDLVPKIWAAAIVFRIRYYLHQPQEQPIDLHPL